MPTVRQMSSGLNLMYKTMLVNGQTIRSTGTNSAASRAQNSIANLWKNYGATNFSGSSSANLMSGLSSVSSNARNLLSSYDTTRETFYTEFDSDMKDLKDSAQRIKNFDFNVGKNAVTKIEKTDADGNTVTETKYNDKMTAALDEVEKFVGHYNDAINFFADNNSVSNRMKNLAKTFGDTTYRASNYKQIGISVNDDGTMEVDREKLAASIEKNPDKVSRILGKTGLADKAQSHVTIANSQRGEIFPTAQKMFGNQLKLASFYTGKSFLRMNSYSGLGNLISMMI